jgi:serine/threonine-protein phosphatase 2A regulatory subunit A
MVRA